MRRAGGLLVRASEAAELLGVNVRVVRYLVASGELEGKRVRGRWYVLRRALIALEAVATAKH